jgi:tol-pal system beta propeller repeat protein TolB
MGRIVTLFIAIFIGEILLLLLASGIYNLLDRNGVFGSSLQTKRLAAVAFIFLPVLCGLVLFPAVIYLNTRLEAGDSLFRPGRNESDPNGKIVYTCQVFGDMDRDQICLIEPDGSGQRRLTQDDAGDYSFPSLSPDGNSVVFTGRTTQGYEVFELELDGELRQVSQGLADASGPDISPDGNSIVFALRQGEQQAIWVMDRDGGNPRQVFGPPDGNGWDPVWSPDGRQILFASDQEGDVQLFRMNANGEGLQQVSQMEGIRGRSDWSEDGRTVATYAGPSWEREIYLMDLDGSNIKQVTDGGNNLAPSFSPDGSWIVFTSYRDRYRDENGCEIYIMNLDGDRTIRLTDNETCDWQPRWGP